MGEILTNVAYFYIKTGPDSFIKYLIEHLLCTRHLGNISKQIMFLDQFFRVTGAEEQIIERPKGRGNCRFVVYFIRR